VSTERKKAIRRSKQIKKQLAEVEDPEEKAKLEADLHIAEVDIDYAIYHPFLERYTSLYAAPGKEEKGEKEDEKEKKSLLEDLHTPRPPMWAVIEKAREEGKAALEKIQNRRPQEDEAGGMDKQKKLSAAKKKKGGDGDKMDESEDGGFFEED